MAVVLSAGPNINNTFTGATKQNIIDGMETQLLAAGWSTVSGHGTTNLLMQTATTPQGLNGRFRFKDNGGSCVQISIEKTDGSLACTNAVANGASLLPGAAKTFRVIACPYQFFVFTSAFAVSREFACGGVPWIPAFLNGLLTTMIWVTGNNYHDTNASVAPSFRQYLTTTGANMQAIINAAAQDWANNSSGYIGHLDLISAMPSNMARTGGQSAYGSRWHNDDPITADPLLSVAEAYNLEGKVRGQLWDAMIVVDSIAGDVQFSVNSQNWWNITNAQNGSTQNGRGALCLLVP